MTKCAACNEGSDGKKKCKERELDRALRNFWRVRPVPSDEALFETPAPPAEECPICMHPIDTSSSALGQGLLCYKLCCGKTVCAACEKELILEAESDMYPCAFCRVLNPKSGEERVEMARKRIHEYDDANAIYILARYYWFGIHGVEKDEKKGTRLYFEAYLKGYRGAAVDIGHAYFLGKGVYRNHGLSMKWYTLAAVEGWVFARSILGRMERNAGNICRAMKHLLMAASAGDDESLKEVMQDYKAGHVKKDDLEKALRAHHQARNDMNNDRRDAFTKDVEDERKRLRRLGILRPW
ncbi:hypothetical protein ACHAWF_013646 [Thalassiosira exigua]